MDRRDVASLGEPVGRADRVGRVALEDEVEDEVLNSLVSVEVGDVPLDPVRRVAGGAVGFEDLVHLLIEELCCGSELRAQRLVGPQRPLREDIPGRGWDSHDARSTRTVGHESRDDVPSFVLHHLIHVARRRGWEVRHPHSLSFEGMDEGDLFLGIEVLEDLGVGVAVGARSLIDAVSIGPRQLHRLLGDSGSEVDGSQELRDGACHPEFPEYTLLGRPEGVPDPEVPLPEVGRLVEQVLWLQAQEFGGLVGSHKLSKGCGPRCLEPRLQRIGSSSDDAALERGAPRDPPGSLRPVQSEQPSSELTLRVRLGDQLA